MYREFFGLSAKPFQLSPDARFFFPSKEHRQALTFLEYGLQKRDGFIVVTGDVGTGKTTLVEALLSELDPSDTIVVNIVSTQLKEDELLSLIALELGLARADRREAAAVARTGGSLSAAQSGQQTRAADRRRGAEPAASVGRRAPHAVELPVRRSTADPDLSARAGGVSRNAAVRRIRTVAAARHCDLSPESARCRRDSHVHRAPSRDRRLAIGSGLYRRCFSTDFCGDARCSAPHQQSVRPHAAVTRFSKSCIGSTARSWRSFADEIGNEFAGAEPHKYKPEAMPLAPEAVQALEAEDQPLASMARMMFDKANVQQRLASLERAVDTLGHSLKDELGRYSIAARRSDQRSQSATRKVTNCRSASAHGSCNVERAFRVLLVKVA